MCALKQENANLHRIKRNKLKRKNLVCQRKMENNITKILIKNSGKGVTLPLNS